ncbi:MAG: hypothetical protein P8P30_01725 [Rickettsiales bacterium]|nr:hypothetical protein [Rickettsiales bacterium]
MAGTINFLDKIPQIAKGTRVLSQQQIYDADFTQAVFDEAHEKGVGLVPEGVEPGDVLTQFQSPQDLNRVIEQYGLDRRAINDKAQMFSQGYQAKNAPYVMDTLMHFGHITAAKKDPLLGAQFAARTAETVRQLKAGKAELTLDDALSQREPRKNEAGYLRASQYIANNAKMLAAAIAENPSLKDNSDVARALTALELLSAQSFQRSSEAAEAAGMGLAADDMLKHKAGQEQGFPISSYAATSTLIAKLENGMNKAVLEVAKKDPAKGKAMVNKMAVSKAEMQQLGVYGTLVLPDVMMKKTKLSFVEQVNQSRNGPDKGGPQF